MQKNKIILSYDYELFFGDLSGTVSKSLIEPTYQLLDAMDAAGLKGNFFVDCEMLKYINKPDTVRTRSDYNLIEEQIIDIVKRGHRVELHIHPHWCDAVYKGDGTWDFSNFQHYSLNSFSKEAITKLILEDTNLLENIARKVLPNYKVVAFRAGGWAVQPFNLLKEGFKAAGIKIDSSPCKGFVINELHSSCDFRSLPEKALFRFSDDVCKEDPKGEFLCVPITRYYRHIFQGILEKFTKITSSNLKCLTDGTHNRHEDEIAIKKGILKQYSHPFRMLSLHTTPLSVPFMMWKLRDFDILCLIQHPKDQTNYTTKVLSCLSLFTSSIFYSDLINKNE